MPNVICRIKVPIWKSLKYLSWTCQWNVALKVVSCHYSGYVSLTSRQSPPILLPGSRQILVLTTNIWVSSWTSLYGWFPQCISFQFLHSSLSWLHIHMYERKYIRNGQIKRKNLSMSIKFVQTKHSHMYLLLYETTYVY